MSIETFTRDSCIDFGNPPGLDNVWSGGATVVCYARAKSFGPSSGGGNPWFGEPTIIGRSTDERVNGWRFNWQNDDELGVSSKRMAFEYEFSTQMGLWEAPVDSINTNEWFHVAVTYDPDLGVGEVPKMYINAVAQTVSTFQAPVGTPVDDSSKRLGVFDCNPLATLKTFDGYLRRLRFIGRVLTQHEIENDFNLAGRSNVGIEDLVLHLPMDEESDLRNPDFCIANTRDNTGGPALTQTAVIDSITQDGDVLVLVVSSAGLTSAAGVAENITLPVSGVGAWTKLNTGQTDTADAGSRPSIHIYSKIADGEPGSFVVTGDQSNAKRAFVLTFRGDNPPVTATPTDVSAIVTGNSNTGVAPSVTPTNNSLVIWCCVANGSRAIGTQAGSMPEWANARGSEVRSSSGDDGHTLLVCTSVIDGGVASGTRNFALSSADEWGALSLAFTAGHGFVNMCQCADLSENRWPNRSSGRPNPGGSRAPRFSEQNPIISNRRPT